MTNKERGIWQISHAFTNGMKSVTVKMNSIISRGGYIKFNLNKKYFGSNLIQIYRANIKNGLSLVQIKIV